MKTAVATVAGGAFASLFLFAFNGVGVETAQIVLLGLVACGVTAVMLMVMSDE